MKNKFQIILGEPVVVARRPEVTEEIGMANWGYYQFPKIEKVDNDRLYLHYHVDKDKTEAYGADTDHHFLSSDNGQTWTQCKRDEGYINGCQLPDGSYIRKHMPRPLKATEVELPAEPDAIHTANCNGDTLLPFYAEEHFDAALNEIGTARKYPGEEWTVEMKPISIPGGARCVIDGYFPYRWIEVLRVAPDGRVWGVAYPPYLDNEYNGKPGTKVTFIVSDDNGQTFHYLSHIPFQPDPDYEEAYAKHQPPISAFSEADIEFLPNGTIVCVMRSQDFEVEMPCYISYSYDNGETWTKPQIFDVHGVSPSLLRLKCGVTLATYGRPGVYLRATDDPEAKEWQDPITIVEPDPSGNVVTCSNNTFVALDDHTAIMTYTMFYYPDEKGEPHKTVLCRTITIQEV